MSLEQALVNGSRVRVFGNKAVIECRQIGKLYLPTGSIVACDPFLVYDADPFEDNVTPGLYPVRLSIAHFGSDYQIAAATIVFSPRSKPREWWMAMTANPRSSRLTRRGNVVSIEKLSDVIVDYGCASFMDARAATWLTRKLAKDENCIHRLAEQMRWNFVPTREWAMPVLDAKRGLNLAMFGIGDGGYFCYWGFDGRNGTAPLCLTIDFGVVREQG
jgi:Protein of unknown function (DUF4241)